MTLSAFCRAIYKPKDPVKSQAKFTRSVFEAAGSNAQYSTSYWTALFRGDQEVSDPVRGSLPNQIKKQALHKFLLGHITPPRRATYTLEYRCREIGASAGLPSSMEIEPDAFIWALTDWFGSIIHDPDHCDVLERCYRLRLEGQEPEEINPAPQPLYQGDRVDVTEPPALQKHKPGFWVEFTHTWTLRNVGSINWTGRTLVCTNPTDPRIRPVGTTQISIPDSSPATGKFIKISCAFRAQGYEGAASSHWEMHSADGENCFPRESTTFNVVATVINPDLHATRQG